MPSRRIRTPPSRSGSCCLRAGPERREVFDLEVAGFLEVVVVGHKVGAFLGGRRTRPEEEEEESSAQHQRGTAKQSQNRSPDEEFVQPRNRTESVLYEQASL